MNFFTIKITHADAPENNINRLVSSGELATLLDDFIEIRTSLLAANDEVFKLEFTAGQQHISIEKVY